MIKNRGETRNLGDFSCIPKRLVRGEKRNLGDFSRIPKKLVWGEKRIPKTCSQANDGTLLPWGIVTQAHDV